MILHIMRKDWKLLWPFVVGVALLDWAVRIADSSQGFFRERLSPLAMMLGWVVSISMLAVGILIVLIVQQDAIPGLRQDWLVRPIRRRDLLLSKLLFVAVLVQGPIFIAEVVQGLAAGFPFSQAIGAPLSRSLVFLLAIDLPVIAFAGLTRNLMEALGAAVLLVLAGTLFVDISLSRHVGVNDINGMDWVTDALQTVWGLVAVAVLLPMLYFFRKTMLARWAYAATALVWLCAMMFPWQAAFAIQERFSPQTSAADPVRVAFDPNAGSIRLDRADVQSAGVMRGPVQKVWVPVRVEGLTGHELLSADRASARLKTAGGKAIEIGQTERLKDFGGGEFHQAISVPQDVWKRIKDQPVRLEIDYWLTLMKAGPDRTMPAVDGNQWIPDTGRCATRMNSDGTQIELGCVASGTPVCVTSFILDPRTGPGSAENRDCNAYYGPYFGRIEGDSLSRFRADFLIPAAATSLSLKDARMVLRVYHPEAHFTRQVVIPDIRLSDWIAK